MAKELYLYSGIYDYTVERIITALEESSGEPVTLRLNCPGGSVFSAYGLYSKIKEHGDVTIKVDGAAMSGGAYLLLYAKSVECLDVSTFLLHRADMYASTDEEKNMLAKVNKDLRAQLEKSADPDIFKEVTGFTYDDLFDPEKRIDIYMDAKQAKKLGLVKKINKLEPSQMNAMAEHMFQIAAHAEPTPNNQKMDINKFKAEHADLFKQVFDMGVSAEKDRTGACLAFLEIDPKEVKVLIQSGEPLSQTKMAELSLKAVSAESLKKLGEENPPATPTGEQPIAGETEKQKTVNAFESAVFKNLNIKQPAA